MVAGHRASWLKTSLHEVRRWSINNTGQSQELNSFTFGIISKKDGGIMLYWKCVANTRGDGLSSRLRTGRLAPDPQWARPVATGARTPSRSARVRRQGRRLQEVQPFLPPRRVSQPHPKVVVVAGGVNNAINFCFCPFLVKTD